MKILKNIYHEELEGEHTGGGQHLEQQNQDQNQDQNHEKQPEQQPEQQQQQDDWRMKIAGDDATKLSKLQRYTTESDWHDSAFQAHEKIRSGQLSTGLPENADESLIREYREANGIPVDGNYIDNIHFEQGVEMNDTDKEVFGPVFEIAHQTNIPLDAMGAMTNALLLGRQQMLEKIKTQDSVDAQSFKQQAMENWHGDYEINMNRVSNMFEQLPESVRDHVKSARMANGKALTSSLEFMNWMVSMDRQLNPMGPLPTGSSNPYKSAQDIISKANERMSNDRSAWFRDTDAQREYMAALDFVKRIDNQ